MRIVIQRVSEASVSVEGKTVGKIDKGLMILVGITHEDTMDDVKWLAQKTIALRIFDDENGVMNRSILDIEGNILSISQFTLMASTKKGNRPSYIRAAGHELATNLYDIYCDTLSEFVGHPIEKGIFGADMKVSLINDGPVTIIIDSHLRE